METTTTIHEQFTALDKIKIFEIPIIDNRSGEQDYIIFDIKVKHSYFIATHVALTKQQEQNNKVAYVQTRIYEDYSLDVNLQYLYEDCINAIIGSDFYTLID